MRLTGNQSSIQWRDGRAKNFIAVCVDCSLCTLMVSFRKGLFKLLRRQVPNSTYFKFDWSGIALAFCNSL